MKQRKVKPHYVSASDADERRFVARVKRDVRKEKNPNKYRAEARFGKLKMRYGQDASRLEAEIKKTTEKLEMLTWIGKSLPFSDYWLICS